MVIYLPKGKKGAGREKVQTGSVALRHLEIMYTEFPENLRKGLGRGTKDKEMDEKNGQSKEKNHESIPPEGSLRMYRPERKEPHILRRNIVQIWGCED